MTLQAEVLDGRVNVYRWDVGTLSWIAWDGALQAGALTIGAVTQAGTWTVQPGNTANTTAWKVDGSAVTQPVSAASLPLPTNAATAALQTQPGVDIGDVTVNNAAGGSAVNIQDGGNTITVDGSVGITGTVDTELPTAAALADNTANPTAPGVAAFGLVWDGTTWDRLRGDTANGVFVTVLGQVLIDGTHEHSVDTPNAEFLPVIPAIATAAAPTLTENTMVALSTDLAGNLRITGSISATSAATATEDDPTYTEAASEALSQDLGGRLRMLGYARVSDTPEIYNPDDIKPLSMTSQGRLRASVVQADVERVWQHTFKNWWHEDGGGPSNPSRADDTTVTYTTGANYV